MTFNKCVFLRNANYTEVTNILVFSSQDLTIINVCMPKTKYMRQKRLDLKLMNPLPM